MPRNSGQKRVLIPPDFREAAEKLNMSPGIVSGDHVFLTGVTGSDPTGLMPAEPEAQFRNIFQKIAGVLAVADLTLDAVVEMTSYLSDCANISTCSMTSGYSFSTNLIQPGSPLKP
jgi:enamine deaminase RidA (YjgF/YER057c/UK114 family)